LADLCRFLSARLRAQEAKARDGRRWTWAGRRLPRFSGVSNRDRRNRSVDTGKARSEAVRAPTAGPKALGTPGLRPGAPPAKQPGNGPLQKILSELAW